MRYKTLKPRLGAYLLDSILLTLIYLVFVAIDMFTYHKYNFFTEVILSLITFWYFISQHVKSGQTFGKTKAFVKLVSFKNEDRLLTVTEVLKRYSVEILIFFLWFLNLFFMFLGNNSIEYISAIYLLMNLIVAYLDKNGRSIRDFLANSVVINLEEDDD